MKLLLFSQYYRCADPQRQREIDRCLQSNLNHPLIDRVCLFVEPGAPPLPSGRCPVTTVPMARRLTYRDWLQRLALEEDAIALLVNADIALDTGWALLPQVLADRWDALALSRYNPQPAIGEASLNQHPHWTQDSWAIRSDAILSASLLHAAAISLGQPGCDNRIAHVLWSHGFILRNPCYHLRTIHHHQQQERPYDMEADRLYGACTYVHPSLSATEPSELEHVIWTRAQETPTGLLLNQRGEREAAHPLVPLQGDDAPFRRAQTCAVLRWSHGCAGSLRASLLPGEVLQPGPREAIASQPDVPSPAIPLSDDTFFLSMGRLLAQGVALRFPHPLTLQGACLRLPDGGREGYRLQLRLHPADQGSAAGALLLERWLAAEERRQLFGADLFGGEPLRGLDLRLIAEGPTGPPPPDAGAELLLFGGGSASVQPASLEIPSVQPTGAERPSASGMSASRFFAGIGAEAAAERLERVVPEPSPYRWIHRDQLDGAASSLAIVQRFGERFVVRSDGEQLWFEDRDWPWLGCCSREAISAAPSDALALLLEGFCQPCLSLLPLDPDAAAGLASSWTDAAGRGLAELDAALRHRLLPAPCRRGREVHLYVAVPWSRWLSADLPPEAELLAIAGRLQALAQQLALHGLTLQSHSVCEHPDWSDHLAVFQRARIDTLRCTGAGRDRGSGPAGPPGLETAGLPPQGLCCQPWPAYPYPAAGLQQPPTLTIRAPEQKPFLASCLAEATETWPLPLRQALLSLADQHRFLIDLQPLERDRVQRRRQQERLLSASVFTLCPVVEGEVGPRFWQALAVGSIPVLLASPPELPDGLAAAFAGSLAAGVPWLEVILVHAPEQIETLPERLRALPAAECQQRQRLALALNRQSLQLTCFAGLAPRQLPQLAEEEPGEAQRPCLTIPHYGSDDTYFWRQKKVGFYELVLAWYLRGTIRIRFGERGYFWWGEPGEILLFDRDLVHDLHDGKKDPPRWSGHVPYRYALFANQCHLPHARHHKMTYWGYAPARLEAMRQRLGRRLWQERTHDSFYAGSIENETQAFFRNRFRGWEPYIDVYACADRLNRQEPLKYSQEQYLEQLAHSRFGVSFRGNGPKCYRELECLALGTPLIITAGVEVDYPEPLQEGLHFLRAECREDIRRIIGSIDAERWEVMSVACWQWFEQHGTIDQLLASLQSTIAGLDPQARKHDRLCIRATPEAGSDCLALRSLRIMDPEVAVIWDPEPLAGMLVVDPDAVIINELPLIGREEADPWHCSADAFLADAERWLQSDHPQHKRLCTLMGLRLRNYTVTLDGPAGQIPVASRISDGRIQLRDASETALLEIDFDWSRRCRMPYPPIRRRLRGPAVLTQAVIEASLHCRAPEGDFVMDLSDCFYDYHAIHGTLIPASRLASLCKLFNCRDYIPAEVIGFLCDGEGRQPFQYVATGPLRFERISPEAIQP